MPKKVDVIPDQRWVDMDERVRGLEKASKGDTGAFLFLAVIIVLLALKVFFWPTQSSASANAINVHRYDIDQLQRRMDRIESYADKQNEYLYKSEARLSKVEDKLWPKPTPAPTPVPKPCAPCVINRGGYYYVYPNWTAGCVYGGTYIPNCN